jgi:endonuclease-8
MPEGDTLHRTADGLRPYLVGRPVVSARANGPGPIPQVGRLVGSTVVDVDAVGKNLLIRFDNGLELRTHLRMSGSWHRYRPGEPWRRPPARARLVLEVPGAVAVCFDAPVVELLETRAEGLHPALASLGPDLLHPSIDTAGDDVEILRRLRQPVHADRPIAEALLDQRALAGIGNVYKSEILFIERVDPWARVGDLDDAILGRLVATARRLLVANADRNGGPSRPSLRSCHHPGSPGRGRPAAVGLRTSRPAVPPLRDAHPAARPRDRPAAAHVLVPALPGDRLRRRGPRTGARVARDRLRRRGLRRSERRQVGPSATVDRILTSRRSSAAGATNRNTDRSSE